MPGKLQPDQFLVDKLGNLVVTDFFFYVLSRTRVCSKQPLIYAKPKYSFNNPLIIFGNQRQKLIDIWPLFCLQKFKNKSCGLEKSINFSGHTFCLFPGKENVVPMFYQYCDYIFSCPGSLIMQHTDKFTKKKQLSEFSQVGFLF